MRVHATILTLLLATALAVAAPVTLIDTDFGNATVAVNDVSADGAKRLTGSVPEGWTENSGWQKEIVVSYTPMEEGGKRFLRVTKTSGGGCQFARYLADVPQETFVHIEFTMRSQDRAGVSFGIRDAGPPYGFHWSAQPALTEQWQDFSYDFRLDRMPQQVGLWVNVGDNVSYDIARLKMVAKTREDIIEELKAKYPEGGPKNLVRVSVFPLGMPTGWALDRDCSDGDDIVVGAAPEAGPSGVAALSVRATDKWRIWAAPVFIGRSFEPHTASLCAKGSGKLRLTAFGDGRQVQSREFELTPDKWERLSLTFSPVLFGQFHQLTLDGTSNCFLDGFQIERGSDATDFAMQQAAQVALGVPESSVAAARIQFTDEPATVRYAVTKAPAGSVLKLKQFDLYGGEIALPDVKSPAATGTIKLALPAARPLGSFRVEGVLMNAQGQAISPVDEVVVQRLRRPRYWNKPAPNSPFGVHTNSTTRHILMAKAVGANWTRLHDAGTDYIGWAHLEPEQGKWVFRDKELQRFGKYGLKILGLLSTAPIWASYADKPRNGYFDRYIEPKDLSQWANYVKVVTERYKGLIDAYDVWNEPWGTSFWSMGWDEEKKDWKRSPTASEDYYKLQKATFDAAKSVDPKLTILGFNTYGAAIGRDWTADLFKFGALPACDVFCYHHYSDAYCGTPGDDLKVGLDLATDAIVQGQQQVGKPIWMTEGSPVSTLLNNGFYRQVACGQPIDDNWNISNRMCRYMTSLLVHGVAKCFLYTMHSHGPFTAKQASWRVLLEDDGTAAPSASAHSHLAWLLEDTKYTKTAEMKPGVFAFLFAGAGRAVAVLSTKPGHAAYALPAATGVAATDLFGNPVKAGTKLQDNLIYLSADKLSRIEAALR